MDVENLSDFDEWLLRGFNNKRRMTTTFRILRKKVRIVTDMVLIYHICRKYAEFGYEGSRNKVLSLCKQSEIFRKLSGPEKSQIVGDGVKYFSGVFGVATNRIGV